MPIGKPFSRGNSKPLMTLQQLAAETGAELRSIRAKIRRSPDRPTALKKTIGRNGGESCTYYDPAALRAWWACVQSRNKGDDHG